MSCRVSFNVDPPARKGARPRSATPPPLAGTNMTNMPEAERPAQPPYRVVNIPPPSPSSAPNSTPAPSASSSTSTPPARAAPPTPAAYQIQHPTVFATPTNFPRKRTRQGFCWGCGASLKEAHSSTCEFDVKRLKPANVPAHVTTVVRAVGGFAILSLFVFTPPPAQGER